MSNKPQVTVVGGGMITHDQILPSLYQMQRIGRIGEVTVCASRRQTVEALAKAEGIARAFPGHSFHAFPEAGDSAKPQPELYRSVIERMPPRQIVIAAVPDQLHYDVIMAALRHDQHVCAVKPLVLQHAQAVEIVDLYDGLQRLDRPGDVQLIGKRVINRLNLRISRSGP